MLEPIRQFALSMLEAAGEVDMIARRHFALFLDFAEQARPKLRGPHEAIWLAHLDRENDNLRAAMAWALTIGAYEGAVRLSWALLYFWWTRSRFDEAHQAMEQVLDKAVGISLTLRIRAAIIAQAMAYGQADHAAVDRHIREVLTLSAQAGGDLYGDAFGTLGLGLAAMTRGQHDIALERMEQSLPLLETADEPAIVAQVYTFLGTTLMLDGQYDAAAQRFEQALLLANKIKDWQSIYNAHYNLAQLALAQHDYDLAAQRFAQGVPLSLERGDLVNIAFCLEGLVVVAGARGQAERAARLLGAAESLIERVGIRGHTYYMPDRSLFARIIADVQLQLGETAFAAARQAGRAMQFEQVIADVHLHHA
jgi:non-specific serine/threonine protein kinase